MDFDEEEDDSPDKSHVSVVKVGDEYDSTADSLWNLESRLLLKLI